MSFCVEQLVGAIPHTVSPGQSKCKLANRPGAHSLASEGAVSSELSGQLQ